MNVRVGWAGYRVADRSAVIAGPVSEMTIAIACNADQRGRGGAYTAKHTLIEVSR